MTRSRRVVLIGLCLFMAMYFGTPGYALARTTHKLDYVINEGPSGPIPDQINGMVLDSSLAPPDALYVATSAAVYGSNASLSGLETSLAAPEGLPGFSGGIGFSGVSGEQQMYMTIGRSEVVVFAAGGCGSVECAKLLGRWMGEHSPSGSFVKEMGQIEAGGQVQDLAVDGSSNKADWAKGDVFVATQSTFSNSNHGLNVVDVFRPMVGGGEEYVTQLTGTPGAPFDAPEKVAVSQSTGDVYVVDRRGGGGVIDVFRPVGTGEYEFIESITPPQGAFGHHVGALAVDGGADGKAEDGDVYASEEVDEAVKSRESVVDEFNEAGEFIGSFAALAAGRLETVGAAAVDPQSHRVFIADYRHGEARAVIDAFGANETTPEVKLAPPAEFELEKGAQSWRVSLNGSVNAEKSGDATCVFVWGPGDALERSRPCEGMGSAAEPIDGALGEYVGVHGRVGQLEPDTLYSYRLQATDSQGSNTSEEAEEFLTPGPGIHDESVSAVSSSSAILEGAIDPNGGLTSYRFEYDTSAFTRGLAGHGLSVPVGDESIGRGLGNVEVTPQHVQGLAADTVYHYRLVAVSEVEPGVFEEFDGPDQTFTTQGAGGSFSLLDGRAWELVSPPDKHGASIFGLVKGFSSFLDAVRSSADGSSVAYTAFAPTEGSAAGFSSAVEVVSHRTAGAGWSSRDISPPHVAPTGLEGGPEYPLVSDDLASGLVQLSGADKTSLSPLASEATPYLRNLECEASSAGECYMPLATSQAGIAQDVPSGIKFGGKVSFAGASPNMKQIVLASSAALTGDPQTEGREELYEWSGGGGVPAHLDLLSVVPEGEGGGPVAGLSLPRLVSSGLHAVSDDGSRVFWSTATITVHELESSLYVRDVKTHKTVRLDVAQPGAAGGSANALFEGASADGSVAFFSDTERLTPDSSQAGADLYRCEITEDGCVLTDLTPGSASNPSEVQNLALGVGANGSYIYFVANGVLEGTNAPSGTGRGECARAIERLTTCNLYVWHDGRTHFIASLSSEDELDWGSDNAIREGHFLGHLTARVSENGRFVVLMSRSPLTGYDNRDVRSGARDFEVFLFDAVSEKLVCVSCNPTGARPFGIKVSSLTGGGELAAVPGKFGSLYGGESWVASNIPTGTLVNEFGMSFEFSRVLSDSGRLFFNSSDGLVPLDVNRQEDVYEYEPVGVGNCSTDAKSYESSSTGCVGLVSSGVAQGESGFLEASTDGKDVFFVTGERLVGEDVDTALDVYDARVCAPGESCGGSNAGPVDCVTAEACRAPVSPQPLVFGPPASATLDGPGDVSRIRAHARALGAASHKCRLKRARGRRMVCPPRTRRRHGKSKGRAQRRGQTNHVHAGRRIG